MLYFSSSGGKLHMTFASKNIRSFFKNWSSDKKDLEKTVMYSVEKYGKTYELLENYEATPHRSAKMVSQYKKMRDYLQKVQQSY